MSSFNAFTTNAFRVMVYLYDNMNKNNVVKTTQQEVGEELALSRVTVSKIFQQLQADAYLVRRQGHAGRYSLTEKAIALIKAFRTVEKEHS